MLQQHVQKTFIGIAGFNRLSHLRKPVKKNSLFLMIYVIHLYKRTGKIDVLK